MPGHRSARAGAVVGRQGTVRMDVNGGCSGLARCTPQRTVVGRAAAPQLAVAVTVPVPVSPVHDRDLDPVVVEVAAVAGPLVVVAVPTPELVEAVATGDVELPDIHRLVVPVVVEVHVVALPSAEFDGV